MLNKCFTAVWHVYIVTVCEFFGFCGYLKPAPAVSYRRGRLLGWVLATEETIGASPELTSTSYSCIRQSHYEEGLLISTFWHSLLWNVPERSCSAEPWNLLWLAPLLREICQFSVKYFNLKKETRLVVTLCVLLVNDEDEGWDGRYMYHVLGRWWMHTF
jgi:hypothetical protein